MSKKIISLAFTFTFLSTLAFSTLTHGLKTGNIPTQPEESDRHRTPLTSLLALDGAACGGGDTNPLRISGNSPAEGTGNANLNAREQNRARTASSGELPNSHWR